MRYISNTAAQQKEMLGVIGAASIEDLLVRIPRRRGCRARSTSAPAKPWRSSTPRFVHGL